MLMSLTKQKPGWPDRVDDPHLLAPKTQETQRNFHLTCCFSDATKKCCRVYDAGNDFLPLSSLQASFSCFFFANLRQWLSVLSSPSLPSVPLVAPES